MYYLNGGVGQLEALRKPLFVNKATYERAQANLGFSPMSDRINLTRRQVWFRTKTGLDVPYWNAPEFKDKDPMAAKSGLIYQPYWMTNKSRARVIQRPNLFIKPKSEVLFHLGTDEADGLGKGFNPIKAITRAVHITPTSFQPKKIFGAIGSITGTMLTGGLGPIIAPKVFSANSSTMKQLGMATTAIAVVAGGVVMGPAIAAALGPTLSSAAGMMGTAVTGLGKFFTGFNALMPQHRQQQANQLTPQQVADVQQGRATFDPSTGQLVYAQQPPGSLMVNGQPVPMGTDPRYNPGYGAGPDSLGPNIAQPDGGGPALSGMLGGMSPIALGLMIGVPLVMQFFLKKGK